MAGKTKKYKGWQLVNTTQGWFAVKGNRRLRVGYSHEEHTDELDARYRKVVEREEAEHEATVARNRDEWGRG